MIFTPYHSSSAGNLYTLESNGHRLLIEAGLKINKIRKAIGSLSGFDGCLITHAHQDHSRGAGDLLSTAMDCYMTTPTAETLKLKSHRLHTIEPLEQFTIADFWTVLPFPTEHDCKGSVGYIVTDGTEKLLFATDTFYIRYKFKGLNIMALECNWSEETMAPDLDPSRKRRLLTSHLSLEHCLTIFDSNDLSAVREIHLLHLSDENSDAELFKQRIQAATGRPVLVAAK